MKYNHRMACYGYNRTEDNLTPHPRKAFRKEGYRGLWYTDIKGVDRCLSETVGPCPECHRRKKKIENKLPKKTKVKAKPTKKIVITNKKVELTETTDYNTDFQETEELQYVKVKSI